MRTFADGAGSYIIVHLYSPRNMVAQANKTASKNTTNEKEEKNIMTVPLYTHKPYNIKFTISTTST